MPAKITRKPRSPGRFREREVARLTRAVREAGGGLVTLDPETGRYTIAVPPGSGGTPPDTSNDLDRWTSGRARQA